MDASLFICTKEEQRAVSQFLWAEIVTGAEMHRRMSVQYGDSVMSKQIVCEWIERLRNGHTSIKNEEEDGCPSTSITDANAEQVFDMNLQNRRVTVDELVHQLPMKLSTTGLPSIESFRDGSKSNTQNGTKRNVLTSGNGFWIAMVLKVTTF